MSKSRTSRLLLVLILATHLFRPLWGGQAQPGKSYGLFVGISRYRDLRGLPKLQFAEADAATLAGLLKKTLRNPEDIRVLVNEQAGTANIREALRDILKVRAGERDTVFLFISARGIATPELADGFLLGFDSARERPADSSVTVESLGDLIATSRARQVFLFADVCRDPTELPGKNLINLNLSLLKQRKAGFSAIVASGPKQLSKESAQLHRGIFSYFLVDAMQNKQADADRDGKISLAELFSYLSRKVSDYTKSSQQPWQFGGTPAKTIVEPMARSLWPQTALLAFFGPQQPGLLANQGNTAAEQNTDSNPSFPRLRRALDTRKLDGPDGIYAAVQALESQLSGEARLPLAVELENSAQETILRYGEGDQFPDDPLRPHKEDFARSADLFRLALRVRESVPAADSEFDRRVRKLLEARMRFCIARALIFDGKYADAITELRKVEEKDWLAEAYNAQGIANLEQGRYSEAIEDFESSLRLAPDWAYSRHNLALTHIEAGDTSEAERDYRAAIKRTPYHPYLYYNLGVLLQRLNRKKEAEQMYRLAIQKFEEQRSNYHNRGEDWQKAQITDQAERALTGEKVLQRNEAEAHNALGSIRQARGKIGDAEQEYQASLRLNPALAPASYNLGALYAREVKRDKSRLEQAITLLSEAAESDPGLLPAQTKLAEVYRSRANASKDDTAALGDLQKAVERYSSVLKLYPESVLTKINLAETRGDLDRRAGRSEAACSSYKEALNIGADNDAERRLQRKSGFVCRR